MSVYMRKESMRAVVDSLYLDRVSVAVIKALRRLTPFISGDRDDMPRTITVSIGHYYYFDAH